eukprot:scaffold77179_cov16-Tisochrysis_lutea.AAC.1
MCVHANLDSELPYESTLQEASPAHVSICMQCQCFSIPNSPIPGGEPCPQVNPLHVLANHVSHMEWQQPAP